MGESTTSATMASARVSSSFAPAVMAGSQASSSPADAKPAGWHRELAANAAVLLAELAAATAAVLLAQLAAAAIVLLAELATAANIVVLSGRARCRAVTPRTHTAAVPAWWYGLAPCAARRARRRRAVRSGSLPRCDSTRPHSRGSCTVLQASAMRC